MTYHWVAQYSTGLAFIEPEDHLSLVNPAKSAFADIDLAALERFTVISDQTQAQAMLDLATGQVWVNGRTFREPVGHKVELVYFRRHRVHLNTHKHEVRTHFGFKDGSEEVVFRLP